MTPTLGNSQCAVLAASSAVVSAGGAELAIRIGIQLTNRYWNSVLRISAAVQDSDGHDSGWVMLGQ